MDSGGARGGDHGRHHHLGQLRPAAWSFAGGSRGVPWPPAAAQLSSSSYTCGYCKRDFRSAQALGGHMNVHRRERARLRHYYSSCAPVHVHRVLPNLNLAPPPQYYCTSDTTTTATTATAVYCFFSTAAAADTVTSTAAEDAALEVDLELGVGGSRFGDGGGGLGLDLELRLGCS